MWVPEGEVCPGDSIGAPLEEQEEQMHSSNEWKPRRRWTWPERWQVTLAGAGLLVTVVATVGQFVR
ncbi:hypothetical protein DY218_30525 [Streptomyces triticagri]|uniref:Uncharacterized protein n=1 Tax=Streptomyces triticagri TaxID=2293568 RepID=A0A372LXV7_9ACTN|nr:hypothetical protein DY218_30525 [Streptomyces triticagri]